MNIEKKKYKRNLCSSFAFGSGLTFLIIAVIFVMANLKAKFDPVPYAAFQVGPLSKFYLKMADGKEIPITLTTYHPNKKECGNDKGVTASGLKIDKQHPQRWLAVGLNYFKVYRLHKVEIVCPGACFLNGEYLITDTSGKNSNTFEILNPNPELVRLDLCLPATVKLLTK